MKKLLALLFSVCLAFGLPAQETQEETLAKLLTHGGAVLSTVAKAQHDSAFLWGQRQNKENALCVADGAYTYGVALNGKPFVLILTFIPAPVDSADSTHVYHSGGKICDDRLPSWHSHIVDNGWLFKPSDCDRHTAAVRPQVPFHLQSGSLDSIRVYFPNSFYANRSIKWCDG